MPDLPGSVSLGEAPLTLDDIVRVARSRVSVQLSDHARNRMSETRTVVDNMLAAGAAAPLIYGVNTGFGALAEVRISPAQVRQLQRNLVRSHAVGVGAPLPQDAVRAMILLRAAVISQGHGGARPALCDHLCELLNRGIHPRVPSRGSVGASGDLAPLAHLALAAIGEGQVEYRGRVVPAAEAYAAEQLTPIELEAKEGLTLLNGTQHMTALGALTVHDALNTALCADIAGALSLEALKGTARAFDDRVVGARPHPGQTACGAFLRTLLADSQIAASHRDCGKVQDPYSLRCMPQVHGATRDVLRFAKRSLECEANSSTDNPLVFLDPQEAHGGVVVSGGNFHGQPIAIALDSATIAVAELANISERRVEQLVNPHLSSGLPPFLVRNSGLHSGYMIAQVTAAALVSENKVLCHPASVDSIPSSAGREDHVSMGALAALKFAQVHDHVQTVLAIELLCAAQGIDLRAPLRPAPRLQRVHETLRVHVPHLDEDRPLHADIQAIKQVIGSGALLEAAGIDHEGLSLL